MRLANYRTSGMHRVAFYYERGLIPALPTPEQINIGIRSKGLRGKLRYWRDALNEHLERGQMASAIARHGDGLYADAPTTAEGYESFEEFPLLKRLLSVPLVRGPVLAMVCPEYALAGRGLRVGTNLIVNHLLYLPHIYIGPTWDLQLLAPDPGGLDLLEERLKIARKGTGFQGQLYRAVAEAGGDIELWFDTLANVIPGCRRLEFPEYRHEPTLLEFFQRCGELEPRDYEHFCTHSILNEYAQMGWPRAPIFEPSPNTDLTSA